MRKAIRILTKTGAYALVIAMLLGGCGKTVDVESTDASTQTTETSNTTGTTSEDETTKETLETLETETETETETMEELTEHEKAMQEIIEKVATIDKDGTITITDMEHVDDAMEKLLNYIKEESVTAEEVEKFTTTDKKVKTRKTDKVYTCKIDEDEFTAVVREDGSCDMFLAKSEANTESESESETETETEKATPTPTQTPKATATPTPTAKAAKPKSISATVNGTHYIGDTLSAADFTVSVTMDNGDVLTNPGGWSADTLSLPCAVCIITVTYDGVSTQVEVHSSERPAATPTPIPATPTPTPVPQASAVDKWGIDENYREVRTNQILVPESKLAFYKINEEREKIGRPALKWDDELFAFACIRAQMCHDQVVATGDCSHDGRICHEVIMGDLVIENYTVGSTVNGQLAIWQSSAPHWGTMMGTRTAQYSEYAAYAVYNGTQYSAAVMVFSTNSIDAKDPCKTSDYAWFDLGWGSKVLPYAAGIWDGVHTLNDYFPDGYYLNSEFD